MYKLSLLFIVLFSWNAFSQKEVAVDDVNNYKEEVKQTILKFFEGFHSGDTLKMKSTMDNNIVMQTIVRNKEGHSKTIKTDVGKFVLAIKNRPAEQKWEERLLSFKIDTDAFIANAWTPYEFYVNDNFSHCGVNVFQLFNDGKDWKIIALADTRHREGCK
ncbi:nuclear transport factor 2 family protein [Aquimarina algiphila]|uniref:nuclear transport factor 2 family protein n=1 Tax=Aquimarina algiphila TaxID=2047982 RepID=UPI002493A6E6|nr:nuclear transport factor 2 family protein [Aquimarina algiphila]